MDTALQIINTLSFSIAIGFAMFVCIVMIVWFGMAILHKYFKNH
jgi:hypothetical protein